MSLVLKDVTLVSRDNRPLLQGVSHTFPRGLTALAGANGAGKSTLLRALATAHPLSGGTVYLGAAEIANLRVYLEQIMFMPQTFAAYPELTGAEFLQYSLRLRGSSNKQAREVAHAWMERIGLAHAAKTMVGSYSQGMLQRLGMAYTFQIEARAYLLDEPFAGVDPESRSSLMQMLSEIAPKAVVVVSTHDLDEMHSYGAVIVRIQERSLYQQ